jgi:hypothetical protein
LFENWFFIDLFQSKPTVQCKVGSPFFRHASQGLLVQGILIMFIATTLYQLLQCSPVGSQSYSSVAAPIIRRTSRGASQALLLIFTLCLSACFSGTDTAPATMAKSTTAAVASATATAPATEDVVEEPPPLASLKSVPVPSSSQFDQYVQDKAAAVQLGKALFWDTRVGSDNKTACATCHSHAGADNRVKNQVSPGLLADDKTFQLGGPNSTLKASDFPFTRHTNINEAATRSTDINDVVS